jgi:hypothetical protein
MSLASHHGAFGVPARSQPTADQRQHDSFRPRDCSRERAFCGPASAAGVTRARARRITGRRGCLVSRSVGTTTTGQRWLPVLRGAHSSSAGRRFRCSDDELGIVPSYSADAPALGVLELKQRRRNAHRRYANDDMEAPSVADDCSDLEHGHRNTPNACAGRESAVSPA